MSRTRISGIRVGILTYHFSENVGALLQAYGLHRWLANEGHQAEFINYRPSYVESGGGLAAFFAAPGIKAKAKIGYLQATAWQRQIFGSRRQARAIYEFQTSTLGVGGPVLPDGNSVNAFLSKPEGRFDMIICGSDQIWAPSEQYGLDPVYYLHFSGGAQRARRVAYAPSFGRANIESSVESEAATYLRNLDGLSARERSGVAIVEKLTGRQVAYVPDPTILYGDYSDLVRSGEVADGGHVFCYALRTSHGIREVAELAGKTVGSNVVSPYNPHRRWREIGQTIHPSPAGWLSHLASAAFVVSNSFHGTVFSVLFEKPFLTVALPGVRADLNERSKNLLQSLGLIDRFVDGMDMTAVQKRMAEPIDWAAPRTRLREMQAAGRTYLRHELDCASK